MAQQNYTVFAVYKKYFVMQNPLTRNSAHLFTSNRQILYALYHMKFYLSIVRNYSIEILFSLINPI